MSECVEQAMHRRPPAVDVHESVVASTGLDIVNITPSAIGVHSPRSNAQPSNVTRVLKVSRSAHNLRTDAAYTEHRVKTHLKFTASESEVRAEFGDSIIDYFTFGKHAIILMMVWTTTSIPLLVRRRTQIRDFIKIQPDVSVPWYYYLSLSPQNEELATYLYVTVAVNLLIGLSFPLFSYLKQSKKAKHRAARMRRDRHQQEKQAIELQETRSSDVLPVKKHRHHRRAFSQPFVTIRETDAIPPLPVLRAHDIRVVVHKFSDVFHEAPTPLSAVRPSVIDNDEMYARRAVPVGRKALTNKYYVEGKPLVTVFGCLGSLLCTMGLLAVQAALYIAMWKFSDKREVWFLAVRALVYAIAFLLWQLCAEIITGWENHRLLHQFRSSYLLKTVLFRISSTIMLFYMTRLYNPDTSAATCVYVSNATQYFLTLGSEMMSTFVGGIILPRLQRQTMMRCCKHSPNGDNSWMPSFGIVQETADLEHKKFMVMLSFTSFPLMACGAIFLYIWELTVDRFKLFYVCRPEKRSKTEFRPILLTMNTVCVALTILFAIVNLYWTNSDHQNCILP